ncbi:MAG: multi-sensor hybrid histidine kinase [Cyanobacteria bacterium RYN_339]|nr:multi-sensor hybrid histidine kinase [Cyanobacteria bacterium RYN_339]
MTDEQKSRDRLIQERDAALVALRIAQQQWGLLTLDSEQEKHRLEQSLTGLSDANRHLSDVDRLRNQFFSHMNHELRTPLNSVIGFLEDTLEGLAGPLNPEQHRYLGHALGSAEHLLNVINEVLDLAFLESGKSLLTLQPAPISAVVEAAMAIMEPQMLKKGQILTVKQLDHFPPVLGDSAKLVQVMLNLLSNANKYTRDGGRIDVDAELDGGWLTVRVRDDGIGIRREDLPRLFEEFTPLAKSHLLPRPGTGLGLSITRRLVELHGGVIQVDSEPGQGSTFGFRVPLASSPA